MVGTQGATDNIRLSSFNCVLFCTVILFPVVLFDISAIPVSIIIGYDMHLFYESYIDYGCLMFVTLMSAVCYNYKVLLSGGFTVQPAASTIFTCSHCVYQTTKEGRYDVTLLTVITRKYSIAQFEVKVFVVTVLR
jgi:hypothetical protein